MKVPLLITAMTPFPHSVERSAPLEEARKLMDEHQVRHLPVTDEHELVGIVTDRDLRSALAVPRGKRVVSNLTVDDIFVNEVYCVDVETPLEDVLSTMADRHIGSAIVTRKGRLAGVFTASDACRTFAEFLGENFPRPDDDLVA